MHHKKILNKCVQAVHTVTSHALVYEAVEQRATVVAEGRARVGVDLELMLRPWILEGRKELILQTTKQQTLFFLSNPLVQNLNVV